MADYVRVQTSFWRDEKILECDDETKLLALYLLTCPHNNILGCFVLPKYYICADLDWSPERLAEPFGKLLAKRFIKYDETSRVLFISNFLKHNPMQNANQASAAIKKLNGLPKNPFYEELREAVKTAHTEESKRLPKPFVKQLLEQLDKRLGNTVTVTVTVDATVTESKDIETREEKEQENGAGKNGKIANIVSGTWNQFRLQRLPLDQNKTREAISRAVRIYGIESVKAAITNYSSILADSGTVLDTRWNLKTFLESHIDKFLDVEEAKKFYSKSNVKKDRFETGEKALKKFMEDETDGRKTVQEVDCSSV